MLQTGNFRKGAMAAAVAALFGSAAGTAGAQSQGEDKSAIQEVIVTAQHVSQPASKTPLSLVAISGDDLKSAGAVTAANLTDMIGNVQIGTGSLGAMQVTIRGVGSSDVTDKGDPSASFNLDGVNIARPQGAGLAFYDLERVEVLRGPQGTLYGRNSTAGAVNLITNKPSDKFEGAASVELGNYNAQRFDGFLNVKVNDVISVRGAVASTKHDGYLISTQHYAKELDDQDTQSARLHVLFKFNPDLRLLLSADTTATKGAGSGEIPYSTFSTTTGDARRTTTPAVQGNIDNGAHGVSAELTANTGIGEVTLLSARRHLDRDELFTAGDGGAQRSNYNIMVTSAVQTSHELRLASSFGAFKSVAGLYWFDEQSRYDFDILKFTPGPGALGFHQYPTLSSSKAGFGQLTYSYTPALRLTVGVRRTLDKKSRVGFDTVGDPVFLKTADDAAVKYGVSNGKLGLDYDLSKSVMLFGSFSTGYKAGGFNNGTVATNPFLYYNPERLSAFEAGAKGRFLGGRLQVSASAFSYLYKDLQLSTVAINPATNAQTSQTRNAARAVVKGLELEGKYALGPEAKIDFSASYLDAHYDTYLPTLTTNWSGYALDKSPRTGMTLGYTHMWELANGGLAANIGTRYSASYVLSDFATPLQVRQEAFHKSNARLTYTAPGDKWTLQAYVKNIENKDVMANYNNFGGGVVWLEEPRTYGLRLGTSF